MLYSLSVQGGLIILAFIGIILLIFFIMYFMGDIKIKKRSKSAKTPSKTKKQTSKKESVNKKTKVCKECGAKIVSNAKICKKCGKKIKT